MNKRAEFIETNEDQKERINHIRLAFSDLYSIIETYCDENSKETIQALFRLEEAQFWAIKSITREGSE